MTELMRLLTDTLPNIVGGLAVAAIITIAGFIYQRLRRHRSRQAVQPEVEQPLAVDISNSRKEDATVQVRHNLPARSHFVNREIEFEKVLDALAGPNMIIAIEGLDGSGKSALALEVAHYCAQQSTPHGGNEATTKWNGIIWLSTEGKAIDVDTVIDNVARVIGFPYIATLSSANAVHEIHLVLQTQRILLLIDGFDQTDVEDVWRFLHQLPEPTKVIITTRRMRLKNVRIVTIGDLAETATMNLLSFEAKRVGAEGILKADSSQLKQVYALTSGNPLLVEWVVGYTKRSGKSLVEALDKLRKAQADAVSLIWGGLWEVLSDNARLLLMVMPLLSGDAALSGMGAIAGIHGNDLEDAGSELMECFILKPSREDVDGSSRFQVHPITRSFAQARLEESPTVEEHLRKQWRSHYVTYANQSYSCGRTPLSYTALEAEHENLLACAAWCSQEGLRSGDEAFPKAVLELSIAMGDYLWARGYWDERLELCKWAIWISEKTQDWRNLAFHLYSAAWLTYWRRSDHNALEQYLVKYDEVVQRSALREVRGWQNHINGIIATGKKSYEISESLLLKALDEVSIAVGFGSQAAVMLDLGHLERFRGNMHEAGSWFDRALATYTTGGDVEGQAVARSYLAEVELESGDLSNAERNYEISLGLATELVRPTTIARCKRGLAQSALTRGQLERAVILLDESAELYDRLGMAIKASECRQLVPQLTG